MENQKNKTEIETKKQAGKGLLQTAEEYGARAEAYFRMGYNCAQAVALAFSDRIGLTDEQIASLAAPFGGGMGRMREVCGAFSGMLFVLGAASKVTDPADRAAKTILYSDVQALADTYREEYGSLICRELLADVQTEPGTAPEERGEAYYKKRPCTEYVHNAAMMIAMYLDY